MSDVNRVQLIGYLTEDVDVRELSSGMAVTDLNIQVKSRFTKDDGSEGISTSFHTVTVWGQPAKFVGEYSRRGSQIYISGRLKTDSWEDDQGKQRWKTKVIADSFGGIVLLDPRVPLSPIGEASLVSGGLNRAEIIGNVTKDLELRKTPGDRSVVNFGVATNRNWKDRDSGEKKEEVEFHNVVLWGRLAEDAEKIMKKGSRVYISGPVSTRSWETPEGEKRYTTEIVAHEALSLGHPAEDLASPRGEKTEASKDLPAKTAKGKLTNKKEATEAAEVPEINYESEIKPEDLPF
ncbi:single-stranded DNA-binding protein [Candidatus Peregrinibacteria bacterium]|nr:single-stranded DNA-binding protein [Candidatus Peregrinibacteria bacterium]